MSIGRPSGVVTFLFTDIEGSTRLLYRLGDERYDAVLEHHRATLRRVFKAHGGHEVRTEGDSFFVAFADPTEAVASAIAAQLALASTDELTDVRVRMGLHTGAALVYESDYSGLAVHQAARIAAAAHGRQVLVSSETADAVELARLDETSFEDLGDHRLKDIECPVRLLQICRRDLERDFPPPRSLERVRGNLAIQMSSFVGRAMEYNAVSKLLDAGRLVTLLGPGGVGKTRLALEVGASAADAFADGVWLVELASLAAREGVADALLRALEIREDPARSSIETIAGQLRDSHALVIIDNCEHVIDDTCTVAEFLLARCEQLRLLATSREALRLPGETTYSVSGLEVPPAGLPHLAASIAETEAVRLFVERAGDVRAEFVLNDGNAADVAAICQRLDGLPLAIELAAARVRSMSPRQIHERLGHALDLLSKGGRLADARQATLRGTLNWSHDLLSDQEEALFRRLAIFAGWRLEAAEEVCAGPPVDSIGVIDALDRLVDKSLVAVTEEPDGSVRYRLLEIIRDYAWAKLEAAGEADEFNRRHATWAAALASQAARSRIGSVEEAVWFDRIEADHANVLRALHRLRQRDEHQEALALGADLSRFWETRGYWKEACLELTALVAHTRQPTPALAHALIGLGDAHRGLGEVEDAERCYDEVLEVARDLEDVRLGAVALGKKADVAFFRGDYDRARSQYEAALAVGDDNRTKRDTARWTGNIGVIAHLRGDPAGASASLTEALQMAREAEDSRSVGYWLGTLGAVAFARAEYGEAQARYREALAVARSLGDRRNEAHWVGNVGMAAHGMGDQEEAAARVGEALQLVRDAGDRAGEGRWLGSLGAIELARGNVAVADGVVREALAIARERGDRRSAAQWLVNVGVIAEAQGELATARVALDEALVAIRELGERRMEGQAHAGAGGVAIGLGDTAGAAAHLLTALGIAREFGDGSLAANTTDLVGVLLGSMGFHWYAAELLSRSAAYREMHNLPRGERFSGRADEVIAEATSHLGDQGWEPGATVAPTTDELLSFATHAIEANTGT